MYALFLMFFLLFLAGSTRSNRWTANCTFKSTKGSNGNRTKISRSFRKDLGELPQQALASLIDYLPQDAAAMVHQGKFTVQYPKYDWNLNQQRDVR